MFQKWFDSFQDKKQFNRRNGKRLFQKPFLFEDERTALSFFPKKSRSPFLVAFRLGSDFSS